MIASVLIRNARGGYSFLKGGKAYSSAVTAADDHEIVHVRCHPLPPLARGYELVERHLKKAGRPLQALCGMELRIPRPLSFQGFGEFNQAYVATLQRWDLFQDGINPVARTNVALEAAGLAEPALHGFSYTAAARHAPRTLVVAGAGELPEGSSDPHDVIRRGETSPEAIAEKARFVVGLIQGRLSGLGAGWSDVTASQIYTVQDVHAALKPEVLDRMGGAARQGVTWFYARPPIVGLEFEMDVRGCRHEIVLAG